MDMTVCRSCEGLYGVQGVLSSKECFQATLKDSLPGIYRQQKLLYKYCAEVINKFCNEETIFSSVDQTQFRYLDISTTKRDCIMQTCCWKFWSSVHFLSSQYIFWTLQLSRDLRSDRWRSKSILRVFSFLQIPATWAQQSCSTSSFNVLQILFGFSVYKWNSDDYLKTSVTEFW